MDTPSQRISKAEKDARVRLAEIVALRKAGQISAGEESVAHAWNILQCGYEGANPPTRKDES